MKASEVVARVNRGTHRLVHNKALNCWTIEGYSVANRAFMPGIVVPAAEGFSASAELTLYAANSDVAFYFAAVDEVLARVVQGPVAESSLPFLMVAPLALAKSRQLVALDDRGMLHATEVGRAALGVA